MGNSKSFKEEVDLAFHYALVIIVSAAVGVRLGSEGADELMSFWLCCNKHVDVVCAQQSLYSALVTTEIN